jgi:hypothetical protein
VLVAREQLDLWPRLVALAGGAAEAARIAFSRPLGTKRLEAWGSPRAAELLNLERQVGVLLLEELRRGRRWEVQAIAPDGRPAKITGATWQVADLQARNVFSASPIGAS